MRAVLLFLRALPVPARAVLYLWDVHVVDAGAIMQRGVTNMFNCGEFLNLLIVLVHESMEECSSF